MKNLTPENIFYLKWNLRGGGEDTGLIFWLNHSQEEVREEFGGDHFDPLPCERNFEHFERLTTNFLGVDDLDEVDDELVTWMRGQYEHGFHAEMSYFLERYE